MKTGRVEKEQSPRDGSVSIVGAADGAVSTFLGMTNRVVIPGDQSGGAIAVVEITMQPGSGAPLHTNTGEALSWYVIEGTLTFDSDGNLVEVAPGGAVYFPRGHTNTFANRANTPVRALVIFVPGGHEKFLLELDGKLPAELPTGPPPEEAMRVLAETAQKHGILLHLG